MATLKLNFNVEGQPCSACLSFNGEVGSGIQQIAQGWDGNPRQVDVTHAQIQFESGFVDFPIHQVQQSLNRPGGPA